MPQKPRLKIIYSSILNRGITLVSHQEDVLDISDILAEVRESIKNLEESSYEQKLTYPIDRFV